MSGPMLTTMGVYERLTYRIIQGLCLWKHVAYQTDETPVHETELTKECLDKPSNLSRPWFIFVYEVGLDDL